MRERVVPSWVDDDEVDAQLGEHVEWTPKVAMTDDGVTPNRLSPTAPTSILSMVLTNSATISRVGLVCKTANRNFRVRSNDPPVSGGGSERNSVEKSARNATDDSRPATRP